MKAVAINGSPRKQHGDTAMLLEPFLQGMKDAGCSTELFYAADLKVKSCTCHDMYCWYKKPGACCLKDDMDLLYPHLRDADILILATPVYVPLPGEMQNVINRLCPLMEPVLEFRAGRTRARVRREVKMRTMVSVTTGGWWEKENSDTVVKIVRELAENTSTEFAGAMIRPHIALMKPGGKLTGDGESVLAAACKAGKELVEKGKIAPETLDAISRPLIPQDAFLAHLNSMAPKG